MLYIRARYWWVGSVGWGACCGEKLLPAAFAPCRRLGLNRSHGCEPFSDTGHSDEIIAPPKQSLRALDARRRAAGVSAYFLRNVVYNRFHHTSNASVWRTRRQWNLPPDGRMRARRVIDVVSAQYGGDSFVIVGARALGFSLAPDEARDIAVTGVAITRAASEQIGFTHPGNPEWPHVSFCRMAAPVEVGDGVKTGRNAVAIRPGKIDRSPCGTGRLPAFRIPAGGAGMTSTAEYRVTPSADPAYTACPPAVSVTVNSPSASPGPRRRSGKSPTIRHWA